MKIRLFIFAALFGFEAVAQEAFFNTFTKGLNRLDVGVHGGGLIALTDVKRYDFYPASTPTYESLKAGGGLTLGYPINHMHALKINTMRGRLGGIITRQQVAELTIDDNSNDDFALDGLKLHAEFYSLGLLHYLNLNQWLTAKEKRMYKKNTRLSINSIFGVDAVFYRSYTTVLSNDNQVAKDVYGSVMYRGYDDVGQSLTNPADFIEKSRVRETSLTTGLEASVKFSKKLVVNSGLRYTVMQSDLLDGWIIDGSDLILNDKFSYIYVGLTYMLRRQSVADEWTSPLDDLYQFKETATHQLEGLLADADKDGVSDQFDRELNTPAGASVDGSGVSIDTDSDGVIDLYDKERFSTLGASVDFDGVELDDDKDGIPNSLDLEVNTAKGEIVDVKGRSIAIANFNPEGASGEVQYLNNSARGVSNGFLPSIYFETASAKVHTAQYKLLASVVQTILKNPSLQLKVVGHTDSHGSADHNETLGYARAAEVVRILTIVFGVPLERFEIETRGETQPLALPPAMQLEVEGSEFSENYLTEINRRVDFLIVE